MVRSGGIRTATCRSNMNGTIVALMTFAEILSLVQTLPDIAYKLMQMLMQALRCRAYPSQALRRTSAFECVRLNLPLPEPNSYSATTLHCRCRHSRVLCNRCAVRAHGLCAFLSQTSLTKLAWEMEACEPRPRRLPSLQLPQGARIAPLPTRLVLAHVAMRPLARATLPRRSMANCEGCCPPSGRRYEKAEHLAADAVSADVVRPMLLAVAHTPIFKELERYELEQLSAYASVSKISAVRHPHPTFASTPVPHIGPMHAQLVRGSEPFHC